MANVYASTRPASRLDSLWNLQGQSPPLIKPGKSVIVWWGGRLHRFTVVSDTGEILTVKGKSNANA